MKFTVIGARGFIGSHLLRELQAQGHDVAALDRGDALPASDLGHVIFAAGITADFRQRPFETLRAHVAFPAEVLERGRFSSFLYLSSARVYLGAESTDEDAPLRVEPSRPDDLYNLSKLAGEACCLAHPNLAVRVVRLSNVVGAGANAGDFVPSLVRDALAQQKVTLRTALESEKDYVAIADVAELLPRIAMQGKQRIYNVASGKNLSHRLLLEMIAARVPCSFAAENGANTVRFPVISIRRLAREFNFTPRPLDAALDQLIASIPRVSTPPTEASHAHR